MCKLNYGRECIKFDGIEMVEVFNNIVHSSDPFVSNCKVRCIMKRAMESESIKHLVIKKGEDRFKPDIFGLIKPN